MKFRTAEDDKIIAHYSLVIFLLKNKNNVSTKITIDKINFSDFKISLL